MRGLSRRHPAVIFIYFSAALFFAASARHPLCIAITFVLSTACLALFGGAKKIKTALMLLPVIAFAAAVNALTAHYGVTVLGKLPDGNDLCLEPIVYGAVQGACAVNTVLVAACFSSVMTSEKLLALIGVHMPKTAMLLELTLRFVPIYSSRFKQSLECQRALFGGARAHIAVGRALSCVTGQALEGAMKTADSMKARGYGIQRRTRRMSFAFTRSDACCLIITLTSAIILFVSYICGEFYALYNPFIEFKDFSYISIFVYGTFGIYYMFPLLLALTEELRWKRCSK